MDAKKAAAEARRQKILARGRDRLAQITGSVSAVQGKLLDRVLFCLAQRARVGPRMALLVQGEMRRKGPGQHHLRQLQLWHQQRQH
jgi:hypothetical protein